MDFHGFLMIFASAAGLGRCRRHKIDPKKSTTKNIFRPTFFSTKMFLDFFRRKKLSMKKIWLPIPMGNFPKIPKITLRTACEHFKKQLEQKVTVYVLLDRHGNSLTGSNCPRQSLSAILDSLPGNNLSKRKCCSGYNYE